MALGAGISAGAGNEEYGKTVEEEYAAVGKYEDAGNEGASELQSDKKEEIHVEDVKIWKL